MQRKFEEVLREAAQQRQVARPLQLRQYPGQEMHAGELTDEDGDKTKRIAPPNRKGTPIPQHVQLCRYQFGDTGGFSTRQGHYDPYSQAEISDDRLTEWNEASDYILWLF